MMHRTVARADREPVGGGDRVGDVGLGGAHRLGERQALGEPRRDRRRQRAAGAVGVVRRDAVGDEARDRVRLDQEIDALGAACRGRP